MSRRDDDLKREIRQHLELEAAEREADGLSPDAARAAASRAFGNAATTREDARAVWIPRWVEHIAQDLRYALRLARSAPGFTCGAVLILALGISATTTIFAAINAVVLTPMPFVHPDQLVRITQTNVSRGIDAFSVSLPLYRDWITRSRSFDNVGAQRGGTVTVQGFGDPQRLPAQWITHTMMPTLGLHVALGRGLLPEDDVVNAAPVVILSHGFWRRAYAADPGVLGRALSVDGQPRTIIGVASADVLQPDDHLILPLVPFVEDRRGLSLLDIYARLRPQVTIDQASSEMAGVAQQLEREYPDDMRGWGVKLTPIADDVIGPRAPRMLYMLLAAVSLLLLVACANLSSLLLVRASSRSREMAIRAAVGGGRGRIVRQLLTESALLAALGGVFGVALSYGGMHLFRTAVGADLPRADQIRVDVWVMAFATTVSAMAGILAGLAPARQLSKLDVQRGLKEGAQSVMRGSNGARNALVIGQLALSVVLLVAAGLMIRTLVNLHSVDLGFTPGRILTVQVAPRNNPEAFFATLLERLRALPDVAVVGATSGAPMVSGFNTSLNVYPVGDALVAATTSIQSDWRVVSDGYFGAMETPMLSGRDFTPRDHDNAPKVIVVNQTLARTLWGETNPIGKQVDLGGGGGEPATVIGLVGDTRSHNPGDAPRPTYYVSAYRGVWGPMTLAIRTSADTARVLSLVRAEVSALDSTLPLFDVRTMDAVLSARLAPQRLMASLLAVFAGLALMLAVVGIYGVMAYSTGQRVREVAIRLALGATRADVIRPLLREGAILAVSGALIGLVVVIPLTRLMRGLLADIGPNDPLTIIVSVVLLTTAALVACYVPARRASHVNPVRAMRGD